MQLEKQKRNTALGVLNSEDFMLDPKMKSKKVERESQSSRQYEASGLLVTDL